MSFEGIVADPQQLWQDVRTGLGERGRALPKHYPLLVTELLGVSPVLTGRFRIEVPLRAAVVIEAGELHWVVAFPVRSGGELLAELTSGSQAPYRAERATGYVRLRRPGTLEFPERGISGNLLLLSSSAAALDQLGAYLGHAALETTLPAPAGSLVVRSLPGAEQRLSRWLQRWWGGSGRATHRRMVDELVDPALGDAVAGITRASSHAVAAITDLLEATSHSELSIGMAGAGFELHGTHRGVPPWKVSPEACAVVARSPYAETVLTAAWGTSGSVAWTTPGDDAAPAGEQQLRLVGPALLGVAQTPQAVAFADAGLVPADPRLLGPWFERWGAAPERSRWRVVPRVESYGSSYAFIPHGEGANPEHRFEVAVATSGPRVRWVAGSSGSALLQRWGQSVAKLPWAEECAGLLFGASLGVGPGRVGAWAVSRDDGFELHARVPLAALLSQAR